MAERTFQGIGVSPGVARGKIYVYRIAEEVVPQYDVAPEDAPKEVTRFEQALIKTREQLQKLQESIASGIGSSAPSSILDVHLSITEDPALIEPVIKRLEKEHKNVEFVFNDVARKYVTTLAQLPDEFLRERAADVQDVTRRILRNLLGHDHRGLTNLPPGTIVVAHDLSPSDTTSLDRKHVSGFATDVGSHTSHTAIVARSMNLPAVVGLRNLSQFVHDGQAAILDGYSGTFIIEPTEQTLFVYGELEVKRHSVKERLDALHDLPAQTLDGHRMILSGNIELPTDVPTVLAAGAEGIGLFRTEFLYLNRKDFPSEEEQYGKYVEVARAVKPHSVIIRTLDIGGDKFRSEDDDAARGQPIPRLPGDPFLPRQRRYLRSAASRHSARQRRRQRQDHVPDDQRRGRSRPSERNPAAGHGRLEERGRAVRRGYSCRRDDRDSVRRAHSRDDCARSGFLQHRFQRSHSIHDGR